MNATDRPRPSVWERSWLVRGSRWLFSWRGIRRILIALAWAATVIALLYGVENWRGRRAWNKYRQQLEARGVTLDWRTLIPKPVPDEQNFAAHPFVASWSVRHNTDSNIWQDTYAIVSGRVVSKVRRERGTRHFIDLVAWQNAFEALRSNDVAVAEKSSSGKLDGESRAQAAPAVLSGLQPSESGFRQLREASVRPHARFPVAYKDDYWSTLLPHLARLKGACQRVQLRACAELALGRNDDAFEDAKLILYLANSVKEDPDVIAYLVRAACMELAVQVVWEGLAEARWSEAQLRDLQGQFEAFNFLADLKVPLATEHAAGVATTDFIRKHGWKYVHGLAEDSAEVSWFDPLGYSAAWFIPSGWYYQERLNFSRLFHVQLGPILSDTGDIRKRISPSEVEAAKKEFEKDLAGGAGPNGGLVAVLRHRVLAGLMLPAGSKFSLRAAGAQSSCDHAAIACALERYRKAKGRFPDKLEGLVPEFMARLPHDVLTGAPYKYRRVDDGTFVLYSVGWNEKDDGGTPGKGWQDENQGDWVWQYPGE